MSWEATLGKWTRTSYGIVHSLAVLSRLDMGNLGTLERNIEESFGWIGSSLGFATAVAEKRFKKNKIKLAGKQTNDVLQDLLANVAEMLHVDLVSLVDELLRELLASHPRIAKARYLPQKVWLVPLSPKDEWSREALLEAYALRNCIVHNNSRWDEGNAGAIARLKGTKPSVGSLIVVGYRDVFNYKRAARTFLGVTAKQVKI